MIVIWLVIIIFIISVIYEYLFLYNNVSRASIRELWSNKCRMSCLGLINGHERVLSHDETQVLPGTSHLTQNCVCSDCPCKMRHSFQQNVCRPVSGMCQELIERGKIQAHRALETLTVASNQLACMRDVDINPNIQPGRKVQFTRGIVLDSCENFMICGHHRSLQILTPKDSNAVVTNLPGSLAGSSKISSTVAPARSTAPAVPSVVTPTTPTALKGSSAVPLDRLTTPKVYPTLSTVPTAHSVVSPTTPTAPKVSSDSPTTPSVPIARPTDSTARSVVPPKASSDGLSKRDTSAAHSKLAVSPATKAIISSPPLAIPPMPPIGHAKGWQRPVPLGAASASSVTNTALPPSKPSDVKNKLLSKLKPKISSKTLLPPDSPIEEAQPSILPLASHIAALTQFSKPDDINQTRETSKKPVEKLSQPTPSTLPPAASATISSTSPPIIPPIERPKGWQKPVSLGLDPRSITNTGSPPSEPSEDKKYLLSLHKSRSSSKTLLLSEAQPSYLPVTSKKAALTQSSKPESVQTNQALEKPVEQPCQPTPSTSAPTATATISSASTPIIPLVGWQRPVSLGLDSPSVTNTALPPSELSEDKKYLLNLMPRNSSKASLSSDSTTEAQPMNLPLASHIAALTTGASSATQSAKSNLNQTREAPKIPVEPRLFQCSESPTPSKMFNNVSNVAAGVSGAITSASGIKLPLGQTQGWSTPAALATEVKSSEAEVATSLRACPKCKEKGTICLRGCPHELN